MRIVFEEAGIMMSAKRILKTHTNSLDNFLLLYQSHPILLRNSTGYTKVNLCISSHRILLKPSLIK
jgi:hypothetical protein